MDVFSQEPPGENPLLELNNVISTPHMGGCTYGALEETRAICVRAVVDALNGRRPQNVINPEVLE